MVRTTSIVRLVVTGGSLTQRPKEKGHFALSWSRYLDKLMSRLT